MKLVFSLIKGKKLPIGTIRKFGKQSYQKVQEGKWIPIKEDGEKLRISTVSINDIKKLKKDSDFRNKFIEQNQAFVVSEINSMKSRLDNIEDAKQDGNIGFIKAIDNFNVKKNPKAFLAYIREYVRGYVLKGLTKEYKNISFDIKQEKKENIIDDKTSKAFEEVEFKRNIELIREKLQNEKQKKVLDLMVQGYNKATIAKMTKTSRANITQIVKRRIKPLVDQTLNKSFSELFISFDEYINLFLEDEL